MRDLPLPTFPFADLAAPMPRNGLDATAACASVGRRHAGHPPASLGSRLQRVQLAWAAWRSVPRLAKTVAER